MLPHIDHTLVLYGVFTVIVSVFVLIDLGAFTKHTHTKMTLTKATRWTALWFSLSALFSLFIYFYYEDPNLPNANETKWMEYVAGYLLEYSLSIDNLFVFIMLFQKFKVGTESQSRVLKWGIIGALILRAIMIFVGSALVANFHWILYVFGFLLLYTALKMFLHKEEEEVHPEDNFLITGLKKILPFTNEVHPNSFWVKIHGKWKATPLFLVLIMVELSDVMFALDSIPAIFSITNDAFIVFTSNIFAILGLRSLYFLINGIMDLFVHLKTGVAIILAFVGFKMILPLLCNLVNYPPIHVPVGVSLGVIVFVLILSILLSIPEYNRNKKGK